MAILLAFSPFIAFVIIERLLGIGPGLTAAALVSAILLLRDAMSPERKMKILEVGTFILFAGLAAYATTEDANDWRIATVRLYVDGGLLLIVLISLLMRRPFTLQYAREQTPERVRNTPAFVRANYVITGAWAAAFAVMVVADLLLLYAPQLPHIIAIVVTIAALYAVFKFTSWYPRRAEGLEKSGAGHPQG